MSKIPGFQDLLFLYAIILESQNPEDLLFLYAIILEIWNPGKKAIYLFFLDFHKCGEMHKFQNLSRGVLFAQ